MGIWAHLSEVVTQKVFYLAGFRPGERGPFVSAKGPKTISAPLWPYGSPPRLANSGGCATRSAQPVLAEFPELAALHGNNGRQGKLRSTHYQQFKQHQ